MRENKETEKERLKWKKIKSERKYERYREKVRKKEKNKVSLRAKIKEGKEIK